MSNSLGFKKPQGEIINLEGELENLTKEDLKERLIVAEKVMKSLFQRNKELEEKPSSDTPTAILCSTC